MARYMLSQNCVFRFIQGFNSSRRITKNKLCSFTNNPEVIHDRQNQRFTVACPSEDESGGVSIAVLNYRFTDDRHVALISTEVPESHRGKGVASHLARAALDFVVEEDLKARISCWYIRKYVNENAHLGYQTYIKD